LQLIKRFELIYLQLQNEDPVNQTDYNKSKQKSVNKY